MADFIKDVKSILPYNRRKYLSVSGWSGVSLQLDSKLKEINLENFIAIYDPLFKSIIHQLDNGANWIVNHYDKDLPWFPNKARNLKPLRALFKQHNIPNEFKGALVFNTEDLLRFSKELITYPVVVFERTGSLYKDVDVSNSKLEFVIHISAHLNIDLLSTDKDLLKEVIKANSSDDMIVKLYRGTTL